MLAGIRCLLITGSAILLFAGCKKDDTDTPSNYLRFKLNGAQVECDSKFYATPKLTSGPDASLTFYGHWGDNALDFQLFTLLNTDITPAIYTFGPGKAYVAEIWPQGTTGNGTHPSYVAGSYASSGSIAGSGQITITEIDARHIKGSFDFVTAVNSITGLFMTVTNGEFYIRR